MTVLKAIDLSVSLGRNKILDQISVSFGAGELVGLIGPNGAGKTSLLKCLLGLLKFDSGAVSLDGQALPLWSRSEIATRLGYLAQGAPCHWPMTVERIVELGRLPHVGYRRQPDDQARTSVATALRQTGTTHLRRRVVTTLSGGECTLVMIARCLAGEAPMLLADEPVTGLDPRHQIEVMQALRAQTVGHGGVVVVLHDLSLAAQFCTRLILMDHGRVVSEGAPDQVLTSENLANVYGIDAALRRVDGQLVVLHQGSSD